MAISRLQVVTENRNDRQAEMDEIIDKVKREGRANLHASEDRRFAKLDQEIEEYDRLIARLKREEEGRKAGAAARMAMGGGSTYGSGDSVYRRDNGHSYFLDLASAAVPGSERSFEAQRRLQEHAGVIDRASSDLPKEFHANPNRTDGQGGYFVPPLWLINEYVALLRAGRATADRCTRLELPTGTDSISLPKVATGTTVATQQDGGAVSSTDLTDTYVNAPVITIAGQQDVALQLLEQSPIAFDEVVFRDLIADYNRKLDQQILTGTGSNGQHLGLLTMSGANAITYTDGSPTVPELWPSIAMALSQVSSKRFLSADAIVMHPSRWYWIAAALDSQNRPLVTPQGAGTNTVAVLDAHAAEGVAGSIAGIPVIVDANVPTNLGSGTNEDRILAGRFNDAFLWEGPLRTRALTETLSGTLQVRLQTYGYSALIPNRYPTALSVIAGTGLITPSGFGG